jgi:hypothetical protein
MRIVFLALSALAVVSAVSLKHLKTVKSVRDTRRAQIADKMKIFSQQADFFYRIPKGVLTPEQKEQVYNDMGLSRLDTNGNHRITLQEVLDQFPQEWRSPEMEEEFNKQFLEIDTDNSGDVDMDEFIAYWRLTVEPILDEYDLTGNYGYDSSDYSYSYPASGPDYHEGASWEENPEWAQSWDSSDEHWNSDYDWNNSGDSQWSSDWESHNWGGDSNYEWDGEYTTSA